MSKLDELKTAYSKAIANHSNAYAYAFACTHTVAKAREAVAKARDAYLEELEKEGTK